MQLHAINIFWMSIPISEYSDFSPSCSAFGMHPESFCDALIPSASGILLVKSLCFLPEGFLWSLGSSLSACRPPAQPRSKRKLNFQMIGLVGYSPHPGPLHSSGNKRLSFSETVLVYFSIPLWFITATIYVYLTNKLSVPPLLRLCLKGYQSGSTQKNEYVSSPLNYIYVYLWSSTKDQLSIATYQLEINLTIRPINVI